MQPSSTEPLSLEGASRTNTLYHNVFCLFHLINQEERFASTWPSPSSPSSELWTLTIVDSKSKATTCLQIAIDSDVRVSYQLDKMQNHLAGGFWASCRNYFDCSKWDGKIHPLWVAPFPGWDPGRYIERQGTEQQACVRLSLLPDDGYDVTWCLRLTIPWIPCLDSYP